MCRAAQTQPGDNALERPSTPPPSVEAPTAPPSTSVPSSHSLPHPVSPIALIPKPLPQPAVPPSSVQKPAASPAKMPVPVVLPDAAPSAAMGLSGSLQPWRRSTGMAPMPVARPAPSLAAPSSHSTPHQSADGCAVQPDGFSREPGSVDRVRP